MIHLVSLAQDNNKNKTEQTHQTIHTKCESWAAPIKIDRNVNATRKFAPIEWQSQTHCKTTNVQWINFKSQQNNDQLSE